MYKCREPTCLMATRSAKSADAFISQSTVRREQEKLTLEIPRRTSLSGSAVRDNVRISREVNWLPKATTSCLAIVMAGGTCPAKVAIDHDTSCTLERTSLPVTVITRSWGLVAYHLRNPCLGARRPCEPESVDNISDNAAGLSGGEGAQNS